MEDKFNLVEMEEKNGKCKIKIDETELKGLTGYELKRDTTFANITIQMLVPIEKLKTNVTL